MNTYKSIPTQLCGRFVEEGYAIDLAIDDGGSMAYLSATEDGSEARFTWAYYCGDNISFRVLFRDDDGAVTVLAKEPIFRIENRAGKDAIVALSSCQLDAILMAQEHTGKAIHYTGEEYMYMRLWDGQTLNNMANFLIPYKA